MSKKNPIQLSDHFTYARLFRFVLPSIVMMVFTSIYGVVDGLFVSNFAGKQFLYSLLRWSVVCSCRYVESGSACLSSARLLLPGGI